MKKIILGVLVLVGAILLNSSIYTIPEYSQVVITQFGKPIGNPVTEPGLHFKKPFVHDVRYVDKRILSWDGSPNQIPTKDKKYIFVDTTARWRVVDALKFIQTVRNEQGAYSRLDSILDSATRTVISANNLVESVRNSNNILATIEEKKKQQSKTEMIDDDVLSDVEKINKGREKLSVEIKTEATSELLEFGIALVDVQLKRISYIERVEQKVYERMISERQRIASKIRSIGKGESNKIRGKMKKEQKEIESEAYKKIQEIKGEGEARALEIYAEAFSQDPEFYAFMKSLEGYKEVFDNKKELILSPNSEYFKYINKK